jgi:hypothetical protein
MATNVLSNEQNVKINERFAVPPLENGDRLTRFCLLRKISAESLIFHWTIISKAHPNWWLKLPPARLPTTLRKKNLSAQRCERRHYLAHK